MADNAINFGQIPRTSRLFNDFLYNFDRVSQFYQPSGLDTSALISRAQNVTAQSFSRDAVADALLDQNTRAGAGETTFANIERLRQKDSVVVITGQQAGLFTGPLYTIFKALTAIKLAERLRAQGVNAVPMFWVAAEDHDFEEVNHTRLINREGQLVTITYAGCSPKEGKPVGHVKLNEKIAGNIDELIAALPESEFMPLLGSDLRDSYQSGANFAEAFGRMMIKTVTDGDNDTATGTLRINIDDDTPTLTHIANAIISNEDTNIVVGLHDFAFGADGEQSIEVTPLTPISGLTYLTPVHNADGSVDLKAQVSGAILRSQDQS